jgi:protein-disulfide isomerase
MSQSNEDDRQGRRTATERMREKRERGRASRKRVRHLKAGGVVVALLAVAAGVGAVINQQRGEDKAVDAKPITVGKRSAPAKLTVYEDFRCPACGQFERNFRSTIRGLEKKGKLKAEYHLVTIIDDNMGGSGSLKAANAAVCAKDEGKFRRFHDVLYRHQPSERNDAFASDKTLIKLAKKVKGLDGPRFRKCVTGGEHNGWVKKTGSAFKKSGYQATPTVLLDGKDIYGNRSQPLTVGELKQRVEQSA